MKKSMRFKTLLSYFGALVLFSQISLAGESGSHKYVIDTKGAHAFVQFRVKHLGVSWLYGRFQSFEGEFTYDAKKPENSSVTVELDTTSLVSDHAERDKHLRSSDFLDVKKYPSASFVSTAVIPKDQGGFELKGKLTLFGQTRDISIDVAKVGEGADPWGGYRVGFEGTSTIKATDFGAKMKFDIGEVELIISLEGIRH